MSIIKSRQKQQEEGIFTESGKSIESLFKSNFQGFLFTLSAVLTICCFTANMFQIWHEDQDVGKEGLGRPVSRFHQQAAGRTASHRQQVDKEAMFKVKKANWKELWY